jgi:hypothetical protein
VAIWVFLLLFTFLIYFWEYQSVQLVENKDTTSYIVLAHSLLYSDKYELMNTLEEPDLNPFPFGFGYPLLLALMILLLPDYPEGMKLLSLVATVTNINLLFWGWPWFSRRSYWWSLAIVGLYGFSLLASQWSATVLSDPIFITFCLIAMLLTEQAASGKQARWWTTLISFILVFVVFTRTIGVVLLAAIFAYLLFRRGLKYWKYLVLIVVQMALFIKCRSSGAVVWRW